VSSHSSHNRSLQSLEGWLDYISGQHPSEIELGLDRVDAVYKRLNLADSLPPSIVVAGTNGKGSTIAAMEAALSSLGLNVGVYTSPHIVLFNERVRICGIDVSDQQLISAFEEVEAARGDNSLTYFEFTTLAAFIVFAECRKSSEPLDIVLCEIGLGGRLDAVNVLDSELALVVSIGLDHQDWLGSDLQSIAREKAGVLRKGRPGLVGESFPRQLSEELHDAGFEFLQASVDFGRLPDVQDVVFQFQQETLSLDCVGNNTLPPNNLYMAMQACLMLIESGVVNVGSMSVNDQIEKIAEAIRSVFIPGRLELISSKPVTILDVGHNEQACHFLAGYVETHHRLQKIHAVFSCLIDKDLNAILDAIASSIDVWHVAELGCERAQSVSLIEQGLLERGAEVHVCDSICKAMREATQKASIEDGVVLAFGSFYVIEEIKGQGLINE
jgi:dihydrofolate synthase/folylpolyglutamate synthase